jgi:hypothetical protein
MMIVVACYLLNSVACSLLFYVGGWFQLLDWLGNKHDLKLAVDGSWPWAWLPTMKQT